MTNAYIHGLHDAGGQHLMLDLDRPGWIVETVEIGLSGRSAPADFQYLVDQGIDVIVRINHGYGTTGTLPHYSGRGSYGPFAEACARYVARSRGCAHWIIGNEPNHHVERPQGQIITPAMYAEAYNVCRAAIRGVPGHQRDEVIVAGPAPWNATTIYPGNERGDWVKYLADTLALIPSCDAISLHAYTHGADPALITSEAKMGRPFEDRRFHFRVYRDFLAVVPEHMRQAPVYITETNQGDQPWLDENTGWVQAAYAEIDGWNQNNPRQQIYCLCLYRWPEYDQWAIANKPGVQADFRAAVKKGYTVDGTTEPTKPTEPVLTLDWDERLTRRGIVHARKVPNRDGPIWRLVKAEYLEEKEHIFVNTLDEQGRRLPGIPVVCTNGGQNVRTTEDKSHDPYALGMVNFPMYSAGWAYSITIAGGQSDTVRGMGLGSVEQPNMGIHISYRLTFQRVMQFVTDPVDPDPPGPEHPILTAAPEDAVLAVHTPIPDWLEVEYGGTRGYAASRYLMLATTLPDATVPGPVSNAALDLWSRWGKQIRELAEKYNVPTATLAAVVLAESSGRAFDDNGGLLIRFENHVFWDLWGKDHPEQYNQHYRFGDPPWTGHECYLDGVWQPAHQSNIQEWQAFVRAQGLAYEPALKSTSYGLPQILGWGYRAAGYDSVEALFHAFVNDADVHLPAMLRWIQSRGLIDELQRDDYYGFARVYNGPGQAAAYAGIIERNRQQFERLLAGGAQS